MTQWTAAKRVASWSTLAGAKTRELALLLLASGILSCQTASEARAEARAQELARLQQAVERVQEADNDAKQRWLRSLEGQPCRHYCELQQSCMKGFRLHVEALTRVRQTRAGTSRTPQADLDRAQAQLAEARALIQDCAELLARAKSR